jgi:hypothetical protein
MRISCRFDGENGTEPRQVPEPPPVVDPGLSGFLTGYQQALEDGTARQVGEGTVDGRPVVWLEMHLPVPRPPGADRTPDPIEQRVAVDRETHRPVLVRSLDGQASYRVLRIETVATEDANFAEPEQAPAESLPTGGSVVSETEIGLDDAQTVLGTQAFWAGERVHGLPLTKVTHDVLSTHYARGSGVDPSRTEGLTLEYGSGERSVTINEATEPAVAYRWPSWDTLWPVPPAGTARVGPFGWAFLVRDGVYVSIMSPLGEEAALDAARALEPIPG